MKELKIVVALAAVALAAAACSGGGGDGGGEPTGMGTLTAGTYTSANAKVLGDGCKTGVTTGALNGQTLTVTLTGSGANITEVNVDSTLFAGSGFTFTALDESDVDLNANGIDCIVHDKIDSKLIIFANDQFYVKQSAAVSKVSGTQCDAAHLNGISLPCLSAVSFEAAK